MGEEAHRRLCDSADSMALEASARIAVTNAIDNKEDLGQMLGEHCLASAQQLPVFILSIVEALACGHSADIDVRRSCCSSGSAHSAQQHTISVCMQQDSRERFVAFWLF